MDSLPCVRLCLLLVTVSSALPTAALLTGDSAKETPRSVSSTEVTVYDCRRCGIAVCELSDFSCCTVIAETQHEAFSNEVIQLETNETRITVCFQQADPFPEGIYAIIWAKDTGIGHSCGMLKAEGNREGAVITGWKKTCCTAEIQLAVSHSALSCSSLPVFADENTAYAASASISKEGTSGITATLTVLVVCAVAVAAYCVLKKRKRAGQSIAHQQIFIGERRLQYPGGAAHPEMETISTI